MVVLMRTTLEIRHTRMFNKVNLPVTPKQTFIFESPHTELANTFTDAVGFQIRSGADQFLNLCTLRMLFN